MASAGYPHHARSSLTFAGDPMPAVPAGSCPPPR